MKKISAFFILGFLLAAQGFAQQQNLQPVAIVRLTKSEPITVGQLKTEVDRFEKQAGRSLSVAERRQILDEMINEKLFVQAAERDKVTITDNEVNQQIQQLRSNMAGALGRQPTEIEFSAAVKNETGMEMPAFREHIKKQSLFQKYVMEKKGDVLKNFKAPTDEDIRNFYELNRSQLVRPETVRFSIVSAPFNDTASKTRAKETADRLAREIGNDQTKFDEVKNKGLAPNAGYTAGDGGYLPRNPQAQQMVGQEFMNIAFSLKRGEISKVIENVQGYQIIMITEKYPQKNLEMDDIFQLGTSTTVKDYIGKGLFQQMEAAFLQKITEEVFAELRKGNPYQVMEANLNW
ncbi:MAG: peptidyl-prolyl cis-trans isomerase [Treponema sp.]|jgi:parvulin-like peptidyl-prolyl isomerase|nr:peptidyl-prolyl cis-trans isomerase [Treponema sp.]